MAAKPIPSPMSIWIETNEEEEAIGTLEAFTRFLPKVRENLFEWRWVILSLHTTFQGFMVVAIRDTANLFPLPDDIAAEWVIAHRTGKPKPRERLDSFLNLYKKIKRKDIANFLQGNQFRPSKTQGRSVKALNRHRNQFVHFLPTSYSLEATELSTICLDCLSIIRFLVHDYRDPIWIWRNPTQRLRIDDALKSAIEILRDLDVEYKRRVN